MKHICEHRKWARTAQERISREFAELKEANDHGGLSKLDILATSSFVGIGQIIAEDEDIESIESETSEELAEERAMWEALNDLGALAADVEANLHQIDDHQEVDDASSAIRRKVEERWFGNQRAS